MRRHLSRTASVAAMCIAGASACVADETPTSATVLEFADARTLFVADPDGSQIFAYTLPAPPLISEPAASTAFNVHELDALIGAAIGQPGATFTYHDLAVHPTTNEAFISVSVRGADAGSPMIVTVNQEGGVAVLPLSNLDSTVVTLTNVVDDNVTFWRDIPASTIAITDMDYVDGQLYVSSTSTGEFAATLRAIPYPFDGEGATTSIEIYHAAHNQNETRAPIRSMAVVDIDGAPTVVAAYTCTPLATIPVSSLEDGAHVVGKTIAELGYGNLPVEVLSYTAYNMEQQPEPFVLVINRDMDADLISMPDLAAAANGEGLSEPIAYLGASEGVATTPLPMAGVMQADDQDAQYLLTLKRDQASGEVALLSYRKGAYFRLSDFISEYNFPDFEYPEEQTSTRMFQNMLKLDEGYPDQVVE